VEKPVDYLDSVLLAVEEFIAIWLFFTNIHRDPLSSTPGGVEKWSKLFAVSN
jgi:hypothetical protein